MDSIHIPRGLGRSTTTAIVSWAYEDDREECPVSLVAGRRDSVRVPVHLRPVDGADKAQQSNHLLEFPHCDHSETNAKARPWPTRRSLGALQYAPALVP